MKKIKTVLIGLGRIGSSLEKDTFRKHPCTHAGVLFSEFGKKHFSLDAIIDNNPDKVFDFLEDWKLDSIIEKDFKELKKEEYDLAIIATNSESHYKNLEFVVKLGIKNILIEKPICLNKNEFQKISQLKNKFQFNLWVNHERRYHPIYALVKSFIDSKKFGELGTIKASVLTNFKDPGNAFKTFGGPLFHDGTHAIDFIDFLLEQEPIKIHSKLVKQNKNSKVEEQVLGFLEYPDNVHAFLEVGGKRNYFQFEIDVQTENARFILSNDGHRFYETKKSKLYKGFKSLSEMKIPLQKENPWILLYKEIYEVFTLKKSKILGSFEANQRIFTTLERIQNGK